MPKMFLLSDNNRVGGLQDASLGVTPAAADPHKVKAAPATPDRPGVRLKERYPRSPRMQFADDSSQVVREYIVPWKQAYDAVQSLLGYPEILTSGGWRYLSRNQPDFFPGLISPADEFNTPAPWLWCTQVQELIGADSPRDLDPVTGQQVCYDDLFIARYENGFITALYESLTYNIVTDADMQLAGFVDSHDLPDESTLQRYVTITAGAGQRYQTLTAGSFVMTCLPIPLALPGQADIPTPYPGTPGRVEIECDLSITWHHIPTAAVGLRLINPYLANTTTVNSVPLTPYIPPIEECLGTVNAFDFGKLGGQCKKGTLLLTAVVLKPIRSPIGMRLWDIEYKWKFFNAQSAVPYTNGPAINPSVDAPLAPGADQHSYGHNLVLYVNTPPLLSPANGPGPGYYEIVSKSRGNQAGANTSNYLNTGTTLAGQTDYFNLFRYRDHAALFRVPQLARDAGNT